MFLKLIWGSSATLTAIGVAAIWLTLDDGFHAFGLALALLLIGCMFGCTGILVARARTLDEEFEAGYRLGFRAGRKAPLVSNVSPIRRAANGLSAFNRSISKAGGRNGAGIPTAPVRIVASHGPAPRRTQAHAD